MYRAVCIKQKSAEPATPKHDGTGNGLEGHAGSRSGRH